MIGFAQLQLELLNRPMQSATASPRACADRGAARGSETSGTLDVEFEAWVRDNPGLVHWLEYEALALKRSGREHYSAKKLVEDLRHNTGLEQIYGPFKVDNSMTSRIARLLMQRHAELEGFFAIRKLSR